MGEVVLRAPRVRSATRPANRRLHATVQAAARLATPHTRASGAIVVTGGGRPLRTGTVAASSGGGGGAKVERDAASEMRGVPG
jgi:hypothetical protein